MIEFQSEPSRDQPTIPISYCNYCSISQFKRSC